MFIVLSNHLRRIIKKEWNLIIHGLYVDQDQSSWCSRKKKQLSCQKNRTKKIFLKQITLIENENVFRDHSV